MVVRSTVVIPVVRTVAVAVKLISVGALLMLIVIPPFTTILLFSDTRVEIHTG